MSPGDGKGRPDQAAPPEDETRANGLKPMVAEPADSGQDYGAAVNEWVNVVRRARLHATTKLIGLLAASYADHDGTSIYPGIARLAVQSGKDYRTVRRELKRLRDMGLIEPMPRKGARRGWSQGYRLIFGADVLVRADVPTPAEEDEVVRRVAKQHRGQYVPNTAGHLASRSQADQSQSATKTPESAGHLVSCDPLTAGHGDARLQDMRNALTSVNGTTLHRPSLTTNPPYEDQNHVRAGVVDHGSVVGAPASNGDFQRQEDQDQDQAPLPRWDRLAIARRQLAESERLSDDEWERRERQLARESGTTLASPWHRDPFEQYPAATGTDG